MQRVVVEDDMTEHCQIARTLFAVLDSIFKKSMVVHMYFQLLLLNLLYLTINLT